MAEFKAFFPAGVQSVVRNPALVPWLGLDRFSTGLGAQNASLSHPAGILSGIQLLGA
jgi:hypothetical protein